MATQLTIHWNEATPALGAMSALLTTFIDRLDQACRRYDAVLPWASPVLSFGDASVSQVATVGINPSNREFTDDQGKELDGNARRLPTLSSLGLENWSNVSSIHLRQIIQSCWSYFAMRPYMVWFSRLEQLLRGFGYSYYDFLNRACHLDLIPFATRRKWGELDSQQQSALLSTSRDSLSLLVRESPIRLLLLNGSAVIKNFQLASGVQLERYSVPAWSLRRGNVAAVPGFAFTGVTERLAGMPLDRRLLILGFNHNLQSTYGLSSGVLGSIGAWVSERASRELYETRR